MRANRRGLPVGTQILLALCGALALSACASHYAQVPARLNLAPYGRVALVTFADDPSSPAMGSVATQQFAEALLSSQSGIELLELGSADSSLKALATSSDASALAQALGREKNVPAVFVGTLKVSRAQPRGHLDASGASVRAAITGELTVRLLSTSTGGTVWRSSSSANGSLGRVAISSGSLPSVAVRDQNEAYGNMVRSLVADVTRDLRPTWVKQ